jgi:hypothetical protein
MGGTSSFDQIIQELAKQQHIMEEMLQENRHLRQQLADLRAGKNIFLEINGTRVALATLLSSAQAQQARPQSTTQLTQPIDAQSDLTGIINIIDVENSIRMAQQPATPSQQQQKEELEEIVQQSTKPIKSQMPEKAQQPFLEEIMISEFESALATNASPKPPMEKPSPEEQKANLRRQLMNSYILE